METPNIRSKLKLDLGQLPGHGDSSKPAAPRYESVKKEEKKEVPKAKSKSSKSSSKSSKSSKSSNDSVNKIAKDLEPKIE